MRANEGAVATVVDGTDLEAIEAAVQAEAVKTATPLTLSDHWQVRGFKHARSRPYPFSDGTGSSTVLAEVIVEIGTTGLYQTGIRISEREYGPTAPLQLRNQKGKVVQLNTRSVGGGNNRANVAIFETESDAAEAALKAWKRAVVREYDKWMLSQGGAASAASSVFDDKD